jgi:hypothetical protein
VTVRNARATISCYRQIIAKRRGQAVLIMTVAVQVAGERDGHTDYHGFLLVKEEGSSNCGCFDFMRAT